MSETPEETIERVKAMGREMQQDYDKVIRMQRGNCALFVILALTVGFFAGAILQDYFSDPRQIIIVPAEDCISV